MRLFDSVLIVDWSSASTPKRGADSIWWALHRHDEGAVACGNPTTRAEAVAIIAHLLATEADLGRRVLAGFDFPFGYPAGTARALTGRDGWTAVWALLAGLVSDGPDNANDRFRVADQLNARLGSPGPFWGRPPGMSLPNLPETKPAYPAGGLPERRVVERRVPRAQPTWKLFTTGSVGGQVLVGLPALKRLREDARLGGRAAVWPFETGLAAPQRPVVIAEIYPSLLDDAVRVARCDDEPKDRTQVRVTAAAYAALDAEGGLGVVFEGPADLSLAERRAVETEEAWILGVGHEDRLRAAA